MFKDESYAKKRWGHVRSKNIPKKIRDKIPSLHYGKKWLNLLKSWIIFFFFSLKLSFLSSLLLASTITKRQAPTENDKNNEAELCKGRPPHEYFRLTADDDCRDVVRCSVQGLLALRCPSGLAFDIEKQTCDWKSNVKNCAQLESMQLLQLSYANYNWLQLITINYNISHHYYHNLSLHIINNTYQQHTIIWFTCFSLSEDIWRKCNLLLMTWTSSLHKTHLTICNWTNLLFSY